jgi:DNA-binding response OmpR family regulator/DNA-binding CsgD family transcriptional regulator
MILLVDDSHDEVKFLADALRQNGFDSLSAHSGEDALAMLERIVPQLIVMDGVMPGLDGFETCRRLKSDVRFAHIPVIFITGLKETEHVLKGFETGGVDYVTKPVRLEELLARIRIHTANAQIAVNARLALDMAGRHLLATDINGQARWCTRQAADQLSTIIASTDAGEIKLPTEVSSQLAQLIAAGEVGQTHGLGAPGHSNITVSFLGVNGQDEFLFSLSPDAAKSGEEVLCAAYALTSREAEVLVWIAHGKSNREISEILLISPRTVNKHLERIFAKLGVENRASAASVALRVLIERT